MAGGVTNVATAKKWSCSMERALDLLEKVDEELREAKALFRERQTGGAVLDAIIGADDAMGCVSGARHLICATLEYIAKARDLGTTTATPEVP